MATVKEFIWNIHGIPVTGAVHTPKVPGAVVVLVHGFGEHSGRYLDGVVPFFLRQSFAVIRYDLYGHGRSGGKRGHCPHYHALLMLIRKSADVAGEDFPDLPLVLYGHSLGGNLVLNYLLRYPDGIAGAIVSSPYLRLAFEPPAWKMAAGKLLLQIMPSITMKSGLDPNAISRIPEEVSKYMEDPLVHNRISPVYTFPVLEAGEWALAHAADLNTPVLLVHGTADRLTDSRATEEFHESGNITSLQLFEEGCHELHHDSCKRELFETFQKWLAGQKLI